ncbi:MAG: VWA domain-containing protein [Acidobacteriota bacterium]
MILRGIVDIPSTELARNTAGLVYDRVIIEGDLYLGKIGDRLVDPFVVVHHIAGALATDSTISLPFYRRLRPGTYSLDLRVADRFGRALARSQHAFVVERGGDPAGEPVGTRQGWHTLTRSLVGMMTTLPAIELRPPDNEPVAGIVSFSAVTTGGPIDSVGFRVDDAAEALDHAPPWYAELTLETTPRPHKISVTAYDEDGNPLAHDRLMVNSAPPSFEVRILEPTARERTDRIKVRVDVPPGEEIANTEIWIGNQKILSRRQATLDAALPEWARYGTHVLRAVAELTNGSSRDTAVVISDAPVETVDVRLVELLVTVEDAQGQVVPDLSKDRFRVLDNGIEQELLRCESVADRPIDVALLMDMSASVGRGLAISSAAARRFFSTVIGPRDRAALLTVNHDIRVRVPFTQDTERLAHATRSLRAHGTTRLHDAVVFSLYGFGGLGSRRALVVLSDGNDVDSDFGFSHVRRTALDSGVLVYPIVIGEEVPRVDLQELANATGGRYFAIRSVRQLEDVYAQIEEELRSQYLLVYRAPSTEGAPGQFRSIDVDVLRESKKGDARKIDSKLRARTVSGYEP